MGKVHRKYLFLKSKRVHSASVATYCQINSLLFVPDDDISAIGFTL